MAEPEATKKQPKRYSVHSQERVLRRTDDLYQAELKISELKAANVTYIRLNDRETGNQRVWTKQTNDRNYIVTNIPKTKSNK